jgi:imidazolonepropionase-like amidohydrolase
MQRAFVSIVFSSSLAAVAQVTPSAQQPLAFTNVIVIDVAAGRTLLNQTVVVDDNRIASLGDTGTVRVPDRARRIDGLGKFLIPGLIDTHVHLAVRADRDELRLIGPLLANGVTGVRDAGAGGQDASLVALRDRITRGEIVAPRLYVSGM